MSAFCAPLTVARGRAAAAPVLKASPTQPLARARAAKPRRVWAAPLACAQQPADKAGAEEEQEQLDENAMRAAEIHEVLTGLKDFKTRIIDDATKLAKKVRAPKKELEAALAAHPDILKIDGHIAELEEELKVLGDR